MKLDSLSYLLEECDDFSRSLIPEDLEVRPPTARHAHI